MEDPNLNSESTPREIIDGLYSLEWCRENLVAPLGFQLDKFSGNQVLTIAVGNFSYLATIGEFIKYRAAQVNIEVQFVEQSADEIQKLLDKAA
jgi:type IV pilus assembly protein PilB